MSDTESYISPEDDDSEPKPAKFVEPAPTDSGELLNQRGHEKGDIDMIKMAIRKGWGVPPHLRALILERSEKIIKKESVVCGVDNNGDPIVCDKAADELAIKAASLVLAIDNHDQADRHLDDRNARLDAGKATENVTERVITVEFDKKG